MQANDLVLAGLGAGDRCWFWLTNRGPDGAPRLVLEPLDSADAASSFASAVREAKAGIGPIHSDHSGVMTLRYSGVLQFRGPEPGGRFHDVLARLVARHRHQAPTLRLIGAEYVQQAPDRGAGPVEARAEVWEALLPDGFTAGRWARAQALDTTLRSLRAGEPGYFWFARTHEGPTLVLARQDESRASFKVRMTAIERSLDVHARCFGDLQVVQNGRLLFVSDGTIDDLLEQIVDFATDLLPWCPTVRRLATAKHDVVSEGTVTRKALENEAWGPLKSPLTADYSVLVGLQERLRDAVTGDVFYFSYTRAGYNGAPALVLTPKPDGAEHHREAEARLAAPLRPWIRGLLQLGEPGGFTLKTKVEAEKLAPLLTAFGAEHKEVAPALDKLARSR